ncbi:MAG: hypothetical protein WA584_22485, partial [Pyrinomonadaceae bacterium]
HRRRQRRNYSYRLIINHSIKGAESSTPAKISLVVHRQGFFILFISQIIFFVPIPNCVIVSGIIPTENNPTPEKKNETAVYTREKSESYFSLISRSRFFAYRRTIRQALRIHSLRPDFVQYACG